MVLSSNCGSARAPFIAFEGGAEGAVALLAVMSDDVKPQAVALAQMSRQSLAQRFGAGRPRPETP
ncbi:hypothetical protein M2324_001956 [Rhodovulum sulfidophilum]|uniref:hypothetical protein n=1 Tax=Rhodovulum sulfidophilum TaxID=35806 RepID=UPI0005A913C7|nr:hypothetical protein [Rhodovulum sulfidophilum]ANB35515.1 hypothetical protein A6W98_16445 [Rhodovulum sulfidophilum DSM 1374]ANB39335.1 hypothetical protein A6024_16300 [Rhodovulum sulfidophilum]MCW2303559.1 hypothetical protein [Rhodovulum sulfidophilum]